ncbi:MAG: hypothetical protein MJZ20_13325 [Bacteroidaceae bacterium]|nr:hypothetical protein [Bacteroidaceae bacterium]
MRKVILFTLFFVTVCCYSNDIIITTQSEKLEVTIVEVGKTEIKYRKVNNPAGPLFVLDKADISSIIYDNGDVEAFTNATTSTSSAHPINTNDQSSNTNINSSLITRLGNNRYSMDGKIMNSTELSYFLKSNCEEAYAQWKEGTREQNLGIATAIIGPILCLPVGLPLYDHSGYRDIYGKSTITKKGMYGFSIFCMTVGAAITIASIPCLVFGVKDRNDAYLTYNNMCAQSGPKLSLNFQMKSDGVGLALNF